MKTICETCWGTKYVKDTRLKYTNNIICPNCYGDGVIDNSTTTLGDIRTLISTSPRKDKGVLEDFSKTTEDKIQLNISLNTKLNTDLNINLT